MNSQRNSSSPLAHGRIAAIVVLAEGGVGFPLNVIPVVSGFQTDFGGGSVQHGLLAVFDQVVMARH